MESSVLLRRARRRATMGPSHSRHWRISADGEIRTHIPGRLGQTHVRPCYRPSGEKEEAGLHDTRGRLGHIVAYRRFMILKQGASHGLRSRFRLNPRGTRPSLLCAGRQASVHVVQLLNHELGRLFTVTTNLRHCVVLMAAYEAGRRASELGRLQVTDIDSARKRTRSPPLQSQAASERALSGLQFHGSNSSIRLLGCSGMRWSTSASQA